MRRDDFRQFLREYFIAEAGPLKGPENKGSTSLDAQVDRLLISYEKEARSAKNEALDFRSMTRRVLSEADDDAEESPDAPKGTADDIDMQEFAGSVVRLIDNYDSLLDVRDTLVRRAQDYIAKKYDERAASDFASVMRDTFDVEVGVTDVDRQDKYQAPSAARAGKGSE